MRNMSEQNDSRVSDIQKIEMMQYINHYGDIIRKGGKITAEVITEYGNLKNITLRPTVDDVVDGVFQVDMDNAMERILPLVMAELAKLRWTPTYALNNRHVGDSETKDLVVENIVRILEKENVPYFFVEHLLTFFSNDVRTIFDRSTKVAQQRAKRVYEKLATEYFGHGEMTMGDVARFSGEEVKEPTPDQEATA